MIYIMMINMINKKIQILTTSIKLQKLIIKYYIVNLKMKMKDYVLNNILNNFKDLICILVIKI